MKTTITISLIFIIFAFIGFEIYNMLPDYKSEIDSLKAQIKANELIIDRLLKDSTHKNCITFKEK